jgi:hypothetical protein
MGAFQLVLVYYKIVMNILSECYPVSQKANIIACEASLAKLDKNILFNTISNRSSQSNDSYSQQISIYAQNWNFSRMF